MIRILYLVFAAALAACYYYFVGAGPGPSEIFDDLEWWRPRGWLMDWEPLASLAELAESEGPRRLLPVYLFWIPPIALIAGGIALATGALYRTLLLWIGLSIAVFAYYGFVAERVWRFFEWRFLAVAASMTATVAVLLYAPSLLRALWRIPKLLAVAILLVVAAGVFVLSTEVTGTDPSLAFNISPWPVVTVFGFLLIGYCVAGWHAAAGAGLWLWSRVGGAAGAAGGVAVAAVLAAAMTFGVFSDPPAGRALLFAAIGAAYAGIAGGLAGGARTPMAASGASRVAAGAVLAAVILVGNTAAFQYQIQARNETAQNVLVALEAYKKDHGSYPERLRELEGEYLEEIPRPRIGLILHEEDEFEYSNFGDSYALEFASVQWVQCAYSPPYAFASYDDEDEEFAEGEVDDDLEAWEEYDVAAGAGEPSEEDQALTRQLREAGLEGSWSCPREPPKIW